MISLRSTHPIYCRKGLGKQHVLCRSLPVQIALSYTRTPRRPANIRNMSQRLKSPTVQTRIGDRAFVTAAPKLWDDLPYDIRITSHLTLFKQKLKTRYLLTKLTNIELLF